MKIQVLIITIVFSLSTNLVAQQHRRSQQQGPPPIPNAQQIEKMVNNLSKELSLSSEQETRVLELYNEHFEEVRIKTSGNARPNREEMQKLKKDFEEKVRVELSSEQQKKYDVYIKEHNKPKP